MSGRFYGRYTAGRPGTKRKTKKESDTFMRRQIAHQEKKKMNRLIKRQLEKQEEKKQTERDPKKYIFLANNTAMSPAISLSSEFMEIAPGTADGQRVGEQIRGVKAMLNIIMVAPEDGTAVLMLFIGKHKSTPTTIPTASDLARIFDDGSAAVPADGTYGSLIRKVNYDEFSITAYRQYKLGQSNNVGFTNNDFKAYRKVKIDVTKQLGGVAKYSILRNVPINKQLYLWATWVNPQTGVSSANQPTMHYYLDYQYTDN